MRLTAEGSSVSRPGPDPALPLPLDVRTLWHCGLFEVVTTRWDRKKHPAKVERQAAHSSIECMCVGSYRKYTRGRVVVGDPNTVVFFHAGESFQIAHPVGEWNSGITVRLSAEMLGDVVAGEGPCHAQLPAAGLSDSRHHAQLLLLAKALLAGKIEVDALEVQEHILQLVRRIVSTCQGAGPSDARSAAHDVAQDRMALVTEYMDHHFAEPLTLPAIARVAECSQCHLAHCFRRSMGLPLHRYLNRVRLRHALLQLADGCDNLTAVSLACGFSSHSHFAAAFRREFGVPPSRMRELAAVAKALLGNSSAW